MTDWEEHLKAVAGRATDSVKNWVRSTRADHRVAFGHVLRQMLAAGWIPMREEDLLDLVAKPADTVIRRLHEELAAARNGADYWMKGAKSLEAEAERLKTERDGALAALETLRARL